MRAVDIWFSLATTSPVSGVIGPPSLRSTPAVASRSSAVMQFGGGYIDGYGGGQQQQGFSSQRGYSSQQGWRRQAYGAPVLWRIYDYYGVKGMSQNRFPALPKYWTIPYTLQNGEDQVLGRWNMVYESPYVSRMQCLFKVYNDGTPTLTSIGKGPTLWRLPNGPWNVLYNRQSIPISGAGVVQVSLDANNPEGAVFTCQQEDAQGGYQQQQQQQQQDGYWQQQQGGYGQQGAYPQQGGYI